MLPVSHKVTFSEILLKSKGWDTEWGLPWCKQAWQYLSPESAPSLQAWLFAHHKSPMLHSSIWQEDEILIEYIWLLSVARFLSRKTSGQISPTDASTQAALTQASRVFISQGRKSTPADPASLPVCLHFQSDPGQQKLCFTEYKVSANSLEVQGRVSLSYSPYSFAGPEPDPSARGVNIAGLCS